MNPFEIGLKKYFSDEQLSKIRAQKIGIAGAGGLGSNSAHVLVRCGFKNFEILDSDIIDASNLNRQLFFSDEVGLPKAETLKKRLLSINQDLNITIHHVRWTKENGDQFFHSCDFIMECFDRAENKHALVNFYHDKTQFLISGNGVAGIGLEHKLTIKKHGNIYIIGDGTSNVLDGTPPLAPSVIGCSAKMAEIVLELTLA
ncbi:MAG: sulfur carrier protein ThiS adenylyltransferase ThiF [Candidatus Omnitrophica bacterium]|nr:sulfur carrier protein ThiS adenylyltransferase ThiF [Candidatus Omnitrophota bacterium]